MEIHRIEDSSASIIDKSGLVAFSDAPHAQGSLGQHTIIIMTPALTFKCPGACCRFVRHEVYTHVSLHNNVDLGWRHGLSLGSNS